MVRIIGGGFTIIILGVAVLGLVSSLSRPAPAVSLPDPAIVQQVQDAAVIAQGYAMTVIGPKPEVPGAVVDHIYLRHLEDARRILAQLTNATWWELHIKWGNNCRGIDSWAQLPKGAEGFFILPGGKAGGLSAFIPAVWDGQAWQAKSAFYADDAYIDEQLLSYNCMPAEDILGAVLLATNILWEQLYGDASRDWFNLIPSEVRYVEPGVPGDTPGDS
jgi:hypothetical protein